MVLSLVELCLVSLRDGIEQGLQFPIGRLLGHMRPRILDMVIMHGTINRPSIRTLVSNEFWPGVAVLDTQKGAVDDSEFLAYVVDKLGTTVWLRDFNQIGHFTRCRFGDNVTTLRLTIYNYYVRHSRDLESYDLVHSVNIGAVANVIAACPRLETLDLRIAGRLLDGSITPHRMIPALLDRTGPLASCVSVLENVIELSVVGTMLDDEKLQGYLDCFLGVANKPIEFKRLATLRLSNGLVHHFNWEAFLTPVKLTLKELHLRDTGCYLYTLLPFPLPHLKGFSAGSVLRQDGMEGQTGMARDDGRNCIGDILLQCPELERVDIYLKVKGYQYSDAMRLLSSIPTIRNVSIYLSSYEYGQRDPYEPSIFETVNLFTEKLTHLALNFWHLPEDPTALGRIIDNCHNLTDFRFRMPNVNEVPSIISCLARLFANRKRASQLEKLQLDGPIDMDVLDLVFDNCINLQSIGVSSCPALSDTHLIEWTDRGARPTHVRVYQCDNITDKGLIPIVVHTGSRMKRFSVSGRITDRMWRIAFQRCRYARFSGYPDRLKYQLSCYCFYNHDGYKSEYNSDYF